MSIKGVKGAVIPAVYSDPKTTPLKFSVKDGRLDYNIELAIRRGVIQKK
jgi:hypothetical protein